MLHIATGGGSNGGGDSPTQHTNVHTTSTPIACSATCDSVARAPRAAAASSKRQDLPELVDHLVHHHEASTRGAVSLCHHSAAAPGYRALSWW